MRERGKTLDWDFILAESALIVESYDTAVTLRQLHYRLVAGKIGGYENTKSRYTKLAAKTAEARRAGWFPALIDATRQIEEEAAWTGISHALYDLAGWFRLDRSIGQKYQVWVLYEKATLTAQVTSWVSEFGIRRGAMRGYSSEPLQRSVWESMRRDGRPIVVFYLGDLDPEGEDIERNFRERAAEAGIGISDEHWQRLAVTPEQITTFGLVPDFDAKPESKRAKGFIAKYGRLFQIEVEAIDPAVLEQLVVKAVTQRKFFSRKAWTEAQGEEQAIKDRLQELGDTE